MAYIRQTWEAGITPINSTNMNNIEDGVVEAIDTADSAQSDIDSHKTSSIAHQAYYTKTDYSYSHGPGNSSYVEREYFKDTIDATYYGVADWTNEIQTAYFALDKEGAFGADYSSGVDIDLGSASSPWYNLWYLGSVNPSDRRLKHSIQKMDSDIYSDLIMKLKPVTYNYHRDTEKSRPPRVGFIAQEVVEAMKEVGIKEDEQNVTVMGRNGMYGLDYISLIPILVATVQKQQEEINALKEAK